MAINIRNGYAELSEHVGHEIEVVAYADKNVAVECITCGSILFDFDKDEDGRP